MRHFLKINPHPASPEFQDVPVGNTSVFQNSFFTINEISVIANQGRSDQEKKDTGKGCGFPDDSSDSGRSAREDSLKIVDGEIGFPEDWVYIVKFERCRRRSPRENGEESPDSAGRGVLG